MELTPCHHLYKTLMLTNLLLSPLQFESLIIGRCEFMCFPIFAWSYTQCSLLILCFILCLICWVCLFWYCTKLNVTCTCFQCCSKAIVLSLCRFDALLDIQNKRTSKTSRLLFSDVWILDDHSTNGVVP